MPNTIPHLPVRALPPAKAHPKPPAPPPHVPAAPPAEHHRAPAQAATSLSRTDISYVNSLLGTIPAQKMEEILLKTGVPVPVNLGPNLDTTA